jgi:hypothetical protein
MKLTRGVETILYLLFTFYILLSVGFKISNKLFFFKLNVSNFIRG